MDEKLEMRQDVCLCPYPNIFSRQGTAPGAVILFKVGKKGGVKQLNAIGWLIWALCDGTRTHQDVLQVLEARVDGTEKSVLARDLDEFVADLVAQRFLWFCPNTSCQPVEVERARPLFIMGNKRSGSTLLVVLLNLHPRIFLTDESDVIWILYQARNGEPSRYKCYPWDDPQGMKATLRAGEHILRFLGTAQERTIAETFFRIQEHLMGTGLRHQRPRRKTALAWIGDKKPVQHSDPELRSFLCTHFPRARHIHIVRDPRAVVASMIKAAKEWGGIGPQYWERTPGEILERWAIHEEWVLEAKSAGTSPIYTLRLEDLSREPVKKAAELFDFLEVKMPAGIVEPIRDLVDPAPNRKYESFHLPISPRAARIMQIYGYR